MPILLKMGEIRGASTHPSHLGWISLEWLQGPRRDGHSAGSVSFMLEGQSEAVTELQLACLLGKLFPRAVIALVGAGTSAITMFDAEVQSISSGLGDSANESHVEVAFESMKRD